MGLLTPLGRALRPTAGLTVLALALVAAPGTAQEPIVFGVIGDSGEVSPGLLGVAREMAYRRDRAKFDFVLMLGDNIYSNGVGRGIQKVLKRRSPICWQKASSSTRYWVTTTFAEGPTCRSTIRRGT